MTEFIGLVRESDTKVLKAKNSEIIKINLLEKFCKNRTKLYLYFFRLDIYICLNLLKFRTEKKCILFVMLYLGKKFINNLNFILLTI